MTDLGNQSKKEKKNYHPNNISGGTKAPQPQPHPLCGPEYYIQKLGLEFIREPNPLSQPFRYNVRCVWTSCSSSVPCSFPENREWSSRGVVILLFATKSVHVACFTDTKQTWFALSDETPAHAMTPAKFYPIGIQYLHKLQLPDLLQDKFERGWYDAQHQFGTHIDLLWLLCLVGRICPLMREHFLWPLLNVKLFIAAE